MHSGNGRQLPKPYNCRLSAFEGAFALHIISASPVAVTMCQQHVYCRASLQTVGAHMSATSACVGGQSSLNVSLHCPRRVRFWGHCIRPIGRAIREDLPTRWRELCACLLYTSDAADD